MAFKMFRYLERHYCGKYRVKARYDLETEDFPRDENGFIDEEYDEQYIPCRRGEIRHTYRNVRGKDILVWYCDAVKTGHNVYKELIEKYPEVEWEVDEELGFDNSYDVMIYFEASEIDKIASVVGARKNGASIKPYSIKNLPKVPYTIPETDLNQYNKCIETFGFVEHIEKVHFLQEVNKAFASKYDATHKEKTNFITKQRNSKLKFKEYVHSVGLWKEYIDFLKIYKGTK